MDLRDARHPGEERVRPASEALGRLPCPTVGLVHDAEPSDPIRESCDLLVDGEEALAPIVEAVRRAPIASMALVQLLRMGRGAGIETGLVSESLVYSTLQAGPEFARWLGGRGSRPDAGSPLEPPVLTRRRGDRLEITLNRPDRHNAFSSAMRDGLAEALRVVLADDTIVEAVVSGAGPSFCSGGDLEEFGTLPDPATAHAIRSTRNVARMLAACADRVRFELHGACIGAGVELPAFALRVSARADAFFQLPEVGMGLVPGAGGTVSLPRRIGRQRAAYLALTGARIDAETARRWGLVDELRS